MNKKYQLKQILSNLETSIGMIGGVTYVKEDDLATEDLVNHDINWAIKVLKFNLDRLQEIQDD